MAIQLQGDFLLKDQFTPALRLMQDSMESLLRSTEQMAGSMGDAFDDTDLRKARTSLEQMKKSIGQIDTETDKNRIAQRKHNRELDRGIHSGKGLLGTIKGIAAAYITMESVKGFVTMADNLASSHTRLAMMNDGTRTNAALQKEVMDLSNRTRTNYLENVNAVAKLGSQTEGLFKSNKELLQFQETLNKQFKLGGAGIEEQKNAMLQLTQAMASGRLQGDEYVSINENAPQLMGLIAKELGVSKSALKELSSEGKITADIIKNALLNATDETNKAFQQMPMTFGEAVQVLKNETIEALTPLAHAFISIINTEEFMAIMDGLKMIIHGVAVALMIFANVAGFAINFIRDHWEAAMPLVIALLSIFIAHLIITKIQLIKTAAEALLAGAKMLIAFLAAHAPLILVIMAIGLLIYILYKLGVTAEDVFGFIGGLVFALGAIIQNVGIAIYNVAMWVVTAIINFFARMDQQGRQTAYNIAKAINNGMNTARRSVAGFVNSAIGFFESWVNKGIRGVNSLISAISNISLPTIDWETGDITMGTTVGEALGINGAGLSEISLGRVDFGGDTPFNMEAPGAFVPQTAPSMEYKSVGGAFQGGQQAGKSLFNNMKDGLDGIIDKLSGLKGAADFQSALEDATKMSKDMQNAMPEGGGGGAGSGGSGGRGGDKAAKGTAKNTADTAKNTADMVGEMQRTNDNLKYLKSVALGRAVSNPKWDKVSIMVKNEFNGDINNGQDLDGFMTTVNQKLEGAIESTIGGVVTEI